MIQYSKEDKILALIGILLAMFLGAIDQTIVATALPRIVYDLHGLNRYAWVATAYMVASTSMVPIIGKLADIFSRKKIELVSVIIFLAGSFLCGLAGEFGTLPILGDGMSQLIIFRAIQGLGSAGLFAMAFIVIADLFPPRQRGKYQGLVGATFGIASVLGPYLGGLLTDHFTDIIPGIEGWRWVFYVNVPFVAIALWFIVTHMPSLNPQDKEHHRLDYIASILLIIGLVPLITALQLDKREYPWTGTFTLVLFSISLVSLVLFTFKTLRSKNPVLDLNLFRNKVFSTCNLALFLLGGAFFSVVIFLPLFMVNVLGVSATRAGISLIPLSLGLVAGSIGTGQLVTRFGHYKVWMLSGAVILMVGLYLLSQMPPDVSYRTVTYYMLVCGLGVGPSMPLYTLAIQNAVKKNKTGQATSASQFFRQIGGTVGAAIMGTILTTSITNYFDTRMPEYMKTSSSQITQANIEATGGANIDSLFAQSLDKNYKIVHKAIVRKDSAAIQTVLNSPGVPQEYKDRIKEGNVPAMYLPTIRKRMKIVYEQRATEVKKIIKEGFTESITRLYFIAIFIVFAGWIVTWFIPELPLRKTLTEENPIVIE